jgi:type IV secretory pathway VirB6-like protein
VIHSLRSPTTFNTKLHTLRRSLISGAPFIHSSLFSLRGDFMTYYRMSHIYKLLDPTFLLALSWHQQLEWGVLGYSRTALRLGLFCSFCFLSSISFFLSFFLSLWKKNTSAHRHVSVSYFMQRGASGKAGQKRKQTAGEQAKSRHHWHFRMGLVVGRRRGRGR